MLEKIEEYLAYQGMKYVKPEKAGELAPVMKEIRVLAQSARREFEELSLDLASKVLPFQPERVSQWMNQAQICRPHFWTYYRLPSDSNHDVALAIRLYGNPSDFGVSVEVSFVERKKSENTLCKQHQVLKVPIAPPLYYFVQENGISHRVEGTENNRLLLQEQVESGAVRKVLVKLDVPVTQAISMDELTNQLAQGFESLLPYYEETKK